VAQLFLDDVEDAVNEIRWAKEAGLTGILLSAPHVLKMVNLYYPELDPVWAVCSELDMPVCIHASVVTESGSAAGIGAALAGTFEASFYPKRQIAHLIANAVFERFPDLKVAATELTDGSAIPGWLSSLDARVDEILRYPEYFPYGVEAAKRLRRKPSEYFATNVFLAGPLDLPAAIASGAPNLMFGADLPHAEGTWPFTNDVLRLTVSGFSEQERRLFLSQRQAQLYGFDLTRLTDVATRVGPLAEDVKTSLSPSDGPRYPYDTRCFVFRPKLPAAGRP
jgi:predicted TIM-barrel fold metal-dependent hydrolase